MTKSNAVSAAREIAKLAMTPAEVTWSATTFHWRLTRRSTSDRKAEYSASMT